MTTDVEKRRDLTFLFAEKLAEFGSATDARRFGDLAAVFAPEAVGDYGEHGSVKSRDELFAAMNHHLGPGSNCGRSQHNVMNVRLVSHADQEAVTVANFYAVHEGLNRFSGQLWSTWGQYRDTWRQTEEGWRIVHRQYTTFFNEGPEEINSRD